MITHCECNSVSVFARLQQMQLQQFKWWTSRSGNRGRSSSSCCAEDRVDSQIQYQRCRRSRRPRRFHESSSWTRLSRCPWWCNTRCPWFRWCRKQLVMTNHLNIRLVEASAKSEHSLQHKLQGECKQSPVSADSSRKPASSQAQCRQQ